jgi:hypothetical protein
MRFTPRTFCVLLFRRNTIIMVILHHKLDNVNPFCLIISSRLANLKPVEWTIIPEEEFLLQSILLARYPFSPTEIYGFHLAECFEKRSDGRIWCRHVIHFYPRIANGFVKKHEVFLIN